LVESGYYRGARDGVYLLVNMDAYRHALVNMIPTYISCTLIKPGAKWSFGADPTLNTIDSMMGGRYYSVTRNKMVADGEEFVDNEGAADETLFFIASIVEVSNIRNNEWPWLVDHIANAGYEDLEEGNMKAIYEVAQSLLDKDDRDLIQHCSFLGGWEVESHYLREEGYSEIDAVNFVGRLKAVPYE
jgi:hypothetical protein